MGPPWTPNGEVVAMTTLPSDDERLRAAQALLGLAQFETSENRERLVDATGVVLDSRHRIRAVEDIPDIEEFLEGTSREGAEEASDEPEGEESDDDDEVAEEPTEGPEEGADDDVPGHGDVEVIEEIEEQPQEVEREGPTTRNVEFQAGPGARRRQVLRAMSERYDAGEWFNVVDFSAEAPDYGPENWTDETVDRCLREIANNTSLLDSRLVRVEGKGGGGRRRQFRYRWDFDVDEVMDERGSIRESVLPGNEPLVDGARISDLVSRIHPDEEEQEEDVDVSEDEDEDEPAGLELLFAEEEGEENRLTQLFADSEEDDQHTGTVGVGTVYHETLDALCQATDGSAGDEWVTSRVVTDMSSRTINSVTAALNRLEREGMVQRRKANGGHGRRVENLWSPTQHGTRQLFVMGPYQDN